MNERGRIRRQNEGDHVGQSKKGLQLLDTAKPAFVK